MQSCVNCHEKNAKGLTSGEGRGEGHHGAEAQELRELPRPAHVAAERSGCMQCHKDETQLFLTRSPPQHKRVHELPRHPRTAPDAAPCA